MPLYFYRDKDQKEIEVMFVRDGRLYAIEIEKTAQPARDAVRHFSVLEKPGLPIGSSTLGSLHVECLPLTTNVEAISACQIEEREENLIAGQQL